jgi:hypothetical protein
MNVQISIRGRETEFLAETQFLGTDLFLNIYSSVTYCLTDLLTYCLTVSLSH